LPKIRAYVEPLRELAQERSAEAVDSADLRRIRFLDLPPEIQLFRLAVSFGKAVIQRFDNIAPKLICGGAGKGYHKEAVNVRPRLNLPHKPLDKHGGLAGTGGRGNKQRFFKSTAVLYCSPLALCKLYSHIEPFIFS
jgi:hypothetical protein